jgi:hypothetical protein
LVAGFKCLPEFWLLQNDAMVFYFTEGFVKGICVYKRLTKMSSCLATTNNLNFLTALKISKPLNLEFFLVASQLRK